MIRLDAVGYAIKKAGTSCFMIPETFRFISALTSQAHGLGIEVLVEIHSHYLQQIQIARQVDSVYDFALPPLVLHSLFSRNVSALSHWLSIRPKNAVTVLDTHDGIGVIDVGAGPEREAGLLSPGEIDNLVETIHTRSNGQSRKATGVAANNLDLYQVNCTFYDALGRRDNEYLIARAIQFFSPGIPQVYYVGLLAGINDMLLLEKTQVGRDINRQYYTEDEIRTSLQKPVVRTLLDLMHLRNTHPAFSGNVEIETSLDHGLTIAWKSKDHWAKLEVDFAEPEAVVSYSANPAQSAMAGKWHSTPTPTFAGKEP
jgi:sucrose phosphorylase